MESKTASFDGLTCTYSKGTGHELAKMEVCVLANFSKTTERNKTNYRDSSTAQVEFKSKIRSKICSLYEEIFQHKGTVPNGQRSRVLGLQSQN